jgi:signal transduction histidine kinase
MRRRIANRDKRPRIALVSRAERSAGARMPQDLIQKLTERNAELTAQVAELTRALAQDAAVSQLVAGVVHDFRNALHVMLLETESLAENLDDPNQLESARSAFTAGQHAAAVARSLLALARKENPRTSLVNVTELMATCRPLIQRIVFKQLACVFDVASDVWPVEVERQQLEAALINLSINARDAMPRGGTLHLGVRNLPRGASLPPELPPGDYVSFWVEDSGTGMSPSVLARATEAFFTTKDSNRGTGLGLSMTHAFATRSGGALQIASELNRGTRVQILLPRACAQRAAVDTKTQAAKLQQMRRRMRTPWLPRVLEQWDLACPAGGLPQPTAAEAGVAAHADCSVVLGVDRGVVPPALRVLRMGDTLASALGTTAMGELPIEGSVVLGSFGSAYRRVLRSCFPSYEYLRYSLGDGSPGEFERLILPAAADGKNVSHLIGVVVVSNNAWAEQ